MTDIYLASKIKYAPTLRALRTTWDGMGLNIHSRWLDQAEFEEQADPVEFSIFWLVDEEDVRTAKVVVVYGEAGDELRGALVEAGMAIALGILVIVVGDSPSFGTWVNHPGVLRARTLGHAADLIKHRFRGA